MKKHLILAMVILISLPLAQAAFAGTYIFNIQLIDVETNTIEKMDVDYFATDNPNNLTILTDFINEKVENMTSFVMETDNRLAVLPVQKTNIPSSAIENILERLIESGFVNTGKYTVVNRSRITEAINTISEQSTDIYDQSTAVEIGRMSAANKVVIADITYDETAVLEEKKEIVFPYHTEGWTCFGVGLGSMVAIGAPLIGLGVAWTDASLYYPGVAVMGLGAATLLAGIVLLIYFEYQPVVTALNSLDCEYQELSYTSFDIIPNKDGAMASFSYRW